jgi:hypothetical protein
MRQVFDASIGPASLAAEGFGGLGLLAEDRAYVSSKAKLLIAISTVLKRLSALLPPLIHLADSVHGDVSMATDGR